MQELTFEQQQEIKANIVLLKIAHGMAAGVIPAMRGAFFYNHATQKHLEAALKNIENNKLYTLQVHAQVSTGVEAVIAKAVKVIMRITPENLLTVDDYFTQLLEGTVLVVNEQEYAELAQQLPGKAVPEDTVCKRCYGNKTDPERFYGNDPPIACDNCKGTGREPEN